jgi:hypothetical protein
VLPIRNIMVMVTPCDYREMGFMSNMFREHRLNPDDVIDETGLVPARALDEGFQSLKPTEYVTQRVNLFENLWNDEFVEGFLAIAFWARDQVPFQGGVFRQTVDRLIRHNGLHEGVIPHGRGEVRLSDITCPFLNAYAEQDTITPRPPRCRRPGSWGPRTRESWSSSRATSGSWPAGRRPTWHGPRSGIGWPATATRVEIAQVRSGSLPGAPN